MTTLPMVWRPALDTVYVWDALSFLGQMESNSVDLVWIDPPYGNNNGVDDLAGARARDKVRGGRRRGEITALANDTADTWSSMMPAVLAEINRVLKLDGCCCCCSMGGGGTSVLFGHLAIWIDTHLSFFHAVVWDKSRRGYGLGWRYRRNYEFVYVAQKRGGSLKWADGRAAQPNVIRFKPTDNPLHPTQKPVELVEWFILNHTEKGDTVLDCFLGSGTTAMAARKLGRHYIGADISPEYVAIARNRLALPFAVDMFATLESEDLTA